MSKETRENGYWLSENIPDSWEWAEFEEIFEDVTSSKKKLPQKSYLEIGCYPVIDQGQESVGGYHDDDSLAYDGLLPVIIFGDHSRCVKFIETKFIQGADGVKVLRPASVVIESFVYCALSTIRLPDKGYSRHFKFLRASKFPIPPFNEQRRIVAKIEALKAHSQRLKEELEAIAPLLDQFRQSVLAAAFRGDLTADWREKNSDVEPASELLKQIQEERKTQYEQACIRSKAEGIRKPNPIQDISISLEKEEFQDIPNSWVWASLESISNFCRPITYGVIKLGDEVENGVPCLRTSDVKSLSIKLENVKKISRAIANNYSRTYLQGGELLVNVRGTLGGVAVVPEHLAGYNISREVAMVPILSNIPVTWTAYWVASVTAQTWLTNVSKGVAYTGINLEDLRQLPVPIPPVAEIKEAVETIEKLYFISSQIEQQYNEAKAHLDKLDQSILAKAFRGELVPQDPNDEPASVLLERIRAERENLDTKKKAKGKTEKKSRKAKPEAAEPKQLSLPGFE